jgi:hypothetical protein
MKTLVLLRLVWAVRRSEGREVLRIAPLAELRASGAVGLRWQAVFGSSDYLE